MTDHWTGIAETGTQAGRRFPAATLLPGATVTPAADWFAPWRVPLGTVPLNEPAASGTSVVVVAGWERWDYLRGVNPAVEAAPLLASGTDFHIDERIYTVTVPVWPPDICGGLTALIFSPALNQDLGTDSTVCVGATNTLNLGQTPPGDILNLGGPGSTTITGVVELPGPLGRVRAKVHIYGPYVKVRLLGPLGAISATVDFVDTWSEAGLPPLEITGYAYTDDPGLLRTEMYSGFVRQRKRWPMGLYLLTGQTTMLRSQIPAAEEFFEEVGAGWFTLTLETALGIGIHSARLVASPEFGSFYGENATVTLQLEVRR